MDSILPKSEPSMLGDAHARRRYQTATEVARLLVQQPEAVARGRAYLERFVRPDPAQARSYATWDRLLQEAPETIGRELLRRDERGQLLRDSAPVFFTFARDQLVALWSASPQ